MAELIELQIIEEIDKVFQVIFRSAHKSTSATNPEIFELIKPLLTTLFIESEDLIDEKTSFLFERLLQKAFKQIEMRVIQTDFVERHQFVRLQRLFDIRLILQEYYERERRAIGFIQLWNKLKRKCEFELSQHLLERRLHQMGFELIHSHAREIIHEHLGQRLFRLRYLRTIRRHRDNGRNLLYFREATVDYMRWNIYERNPSRAGTTITVIVYFAAIESGLVDFMFIEKSCQTTEIFVDWLKSVAKTQSSNSLILLDPKNYNDPARRTEELLNTDDTQIDDRMVNVVAAMDEYEILYLPSNHSELNPLHRIDFEHILDDKRWPTNDSNEKTVQDKVKLIEEYLKMGVRHRLTTTTVNEWNQYFEDVQKNEENFLRFEAFLDDDAICVDDIQDSEESDVEIIGEIDDDDVIHVSDNEIIVL